MEMDQILKALYKIKAEVDSLIANIASNATITATVEEVRRVAILEEIYRLGQATPKQISEIAVKYGKTPSSTAGYYSGNAPSLKGSVNKKGEAVRKLTQHGEAVVMNYRSRWGEDWLDRIPIEDVGNSNAKTTFVKF